MAWGMGGRSAQGFQEVGVGCSKLLLGTELEYGMQFSVWSVRMSLQPERGTHVTMGTYYHQRANGDKIGLFSPKVRSKYFKPVSAL